MKIGVSITVSVLTELKLAQEEAELEHKDTVDILNFNDPYEK